MAQAHARTDFIMGDELLKRAWAGRCPHPLPELRADRLSACLRCNDCGMQMAFELRLGRPRVFDVRVTDGGTRDIGTFSSGTCLDFIWNRAAGPPAPGPGDDVSDSGRAMLGVLMEELYGEAWCWAASAVDFRDVWHDSRCEHRPAECSVYGESIVMWCDDCGLRTAFALQGGDEFRVSAGNTKYGRHDAFVVMDHIRNFAGIVTLPDKMADKMSDNPERDAARAMAVVSLLERHMLVRRVEPDANPRARLSVMNAARREFEADAEVVAAYGGRAADILEVDAARLAWPCGFAGKDLNVDIGSYDPDGCMRFCPRCWYVDEDVGCWRDGCQKCGYVGYLFDV